MELELYKAEILELSKYPMDVLQQLATEAQEEGNYLLLSHLYYIMYTKTKGA